MMPRLMDMSSSLIDWLLATTHTTCITTSQDKKDATKTKTDNEAAMSCKNDAKMRVKIGG
jgi:hypothetical protein